MARRCSVGFGRFRLIQRTVSPASVAVVAPILRVSGNETVKVPNGRKPLLVAQAFVRFPLVPGKDLFRRPIKAEVLGVTLPETAPAIQPSVCRQVDHVAAFVESLSGGDFAQRTKVIQLHLFPAM